MSEECWISGKQGGQTLIRYCILQHLICVYTVYSGQSIPIHVQSTLLIPTLDTMTKFIIMTIWMSQNLSSRGDSKREIMQEHCIKTSSDICFGYLLELPHWGDSNKYPRHTLYEKIRTKQGLSYFSFCQLRILYNSKFILMAISLGTTAVVVMRVHCTWLIWYLY